MAEIDMETAARVEAMKQMERQQATAAALMGSLASCLPTSTEADTYMAEITEARKRVLLRLGQAACGVELMTPEELEAARIMLSAGF
jgi:ABC-type uncharacterized transport system auxiliary subunit